MKRIILTTLLLSVSGSAFADAAGGPGCGWGQALFKGSSGLATHVVAATTNGISANNTFGMTSGTNGCDTSGSLTYGGEAMVGAVMDEFSEDVARGDGEALTAVSVSLGISEDDRLLFKQVMHDNFTTMFPSDDVTAREVTDTIIALMLEDEVLAKYVS
jgi:hypothetical protein